MRNAVVVIALAIALAVLVWIRFLGPDAVSFGATGPPAVALSVQVPVRGDMAAVRSDRPGLRVLFVGNSFTYFNDMPAMVQRLAAGDPQARPLFAAWYARGGGTLAQAADDDDLRELIASEHWDAVVLQEQSWIPSSPAAREREMLPAARTLAGLVRKRGARTVLYMTWGYRHGDRELPGDSYAAMQARVTASYTAAGRRLRAQVAPVGLAWRSAFRERPSLELRGPDGHHPNRAGSYLAASVLYARLTGRDPRASRFAAGLPRGEANMLRRIASASGARSVHYEGTGDRPHSAVRFHRHAHTTDYQLTYRAPCDAPDTQESGEYGTSSTPGERPLRVGRHGRFRMHRHYRSRYSGTIIDMRLSGRLRKSTGSGTFSGSFTNDGDGGPVIHCHTGLVHWTARREPAGRR